MIQLQALDWMHQPEMAGWVVPWSAAEKPWNRQTNIREDFGTLVAGALALEPAVKEFQYPGEHVVAIMGVTE